MVTQVVIGIGICSSELTLYSSLTGVLSKTPQHHLTPTLRYPIFEWTNHVLVYHFGVPKLRKESEIRTRERMREREAFIPACCYLQFLLVPFKADQTREKRDRDREMY